MSYLAHSKYCIEKETISEGNKKQAFAIKWSNKELVHLFYCETYNR